MNDKAATEAIKDTVILWQDHSKEIGYRDSLKLITFEDKTQCLQLSCGGFVTRLKYVFPYSKEDRL